MLPGFCIFNLNKKKVTRGHYKGQQTGKVIQCYRKKFVIHIERIQREKANGATVHVGIHPSNVNFSRFRYWLLTYFLKCFFFLSRSLSPNLNWTRTERASWKESPAPNKPRKENTPKRVSNKIWKHNKNIFFIVYQITII